MIGLRSKLILSLFLFVAFTAWVNEVNSQAVMIFPQYYICSYLRVKGYYYFQGTRKVIFYERDKTIAGNTLNETFWQSLGLSSKTFDDAMLKYKQIYNETNNCTTNFCTCVASTFIDDPYESTFSIFFRNETNFVAVKPIIAAFLNKTRPDQSDITTWMEFYASQIGSFSNTLTQYLMNNDYTSRTLKTEESQCVFDKNSVSSNLILK